MEGPEIKTVALYTRVSTEDQAKEGYSLESQLDRLRAYCQARQWQIFHEYIDAGKSGRNTRRPQYQQMFNEIDYWDGILVIKMDRIHRNHSNFLSMMRDLEKKGKQFISMSESLDTSTAMGRFVMGIIQQIAQLESEQTGERVFWGMEQKAKDLDSGFVGHKLPFGYKFDKNHKIIEVIEEINIIKKVFELYLKGSSMREIAKELNLSNTNVRYYLHNCFYAGMERWGLYYKKACIEPIFSKDQWNIIQKKLREQCRSHINYKPVKLDDKDSMKLHWKEARDIPIINRPKQHKVF